MEYLKPLGWLWFAPVDSIGKQVFVTIPSGVYRSFWYVSGWNQFGWPSWTYAPFWIVLFLALAGLLLRRRPPSGTPARAVIVLGVVALGALSTIWMIGLQAQTFQARVAFIGLPAIGCLAALGLERWRIPLALRFAGPALGLAGTLFAIRHDILRLL
jgi:hypothetical protein